MTGKQVESYIRKDLDMTPRHNVDALASAITDMASELEFSEFELLQLLLENKPIDAIHTHSYGFHTANGRHIIDKIKEYYYEYAN